MSNTQIKAIYDNGGKTFDRYTVYFNEQERKGLFTCLGLSEHPTHPQGFGQHSAGQLGKHNGKRIAFADLTDDGQKAVWFELFDNPMPDCLTYSREPTPAEIRFGEGARHYKDFPAADCLTGSGAIKKRIKDTAYGLIYTRN